MMYVDHPRLATLRTKRNNNNDSLLPRAYGPLRVIHISSRTVTAEKYGIPNILSVHQASSILGTIEHPRRSKGSMTSSKFKKTLHWNNFNTKTGNFLLLLITLSKGAGLTLLSYKSTKTSSKVHNWLTTDTVRRPKQSIWERLWLYNRGCSSRTHDRDLYEIDPLGRGYKHASWS